MLLFGKKILRKEVKINYDLCWFSKTSENDLKECADLYFEKLFWICEKYQ